MSPTEMGSSEAARTLPPSQLSATAASIPPHRAIRYRALPLTGSDKPLWVCQTLPPTRQWPVPRVARPLVPGSSGVAVAGEAQRQDPGQVRSTVLDPMNGKATLGVPHGADVTRRRQVPHPSIFLPPCLASHFPSRTCLPSASSYPFASIQPLTR